VIGISLANLVRPGERIDATTAQALVQRYGADASRRVQAATAQAGPSPSPMMQVVRTLVPSNPVAAVASETPNMLYLMFFAVILAVSITLLPQADTKPLIHFFDALFQVSTKIIDIVMWFAPLAVACLLFTTTARFGFDLLRALAWYVVAVLVGLALHMFGVYSLSVALLSRISPIEFFRRVRTVMLTAFSTSSSNATLPTALRVSEENLGVPREINTFVLTVGATMNQNGTALYEGMTVLFLAQLAGIHLSLGQQVVVAYLAILGGVGTAGVPSGSIPFIIVVLTTIGVNPSLIALILGVDRILDMCRTTLNVTGDITAATYIARSEGYPLLQQAMVEVHQETPLH
jgi:DAACS family dicarboxylate/amino acid:cation (Na+ or H+) symporter